VPPGGGWSPSDPFAVWCVIGRHAQGQEPEGSPDRNAGGKAARAGCTDQEFIFFFWVVWGVRHKRRAQQQASPGASKALLQSQPRSLS